MNLILPPEQVLPRVHVPSTCIYQRLGLQKHHRVLTEYLRSYYAVSRGKEVWLVKRSHPLKPESIKRYEISGVNDE